MGTRWRGNMGGGGWAWELIDGSEKDISHRWRGVGAHLGEWDGGALREGREA